MKSVITFLSLLIFSLCSCEDNASFSNNVALLGTKKDTISTDEKPIVIWTNNPFAKKLIDDATIYDLINSCMVTDTSYFKYCNTIIGREFIPLFYDKEDLMKADSIFNTKDVDLFWNKHNMAHYLRLTKQS